MGREGVSLPSWLEGLGERHTLIQWGSGGGPADHTFWHILKLTADRIHLLTKNAVFSTILEKWDFKNATQMMEIH